MGGKGSGRRCHYDDLAIADVVNKSISLIRAYIVDEFVPLDKRVEVARHFAVKAVPEKIEGNFSGEVFFMPVVKIDGKPMPIKIGDEKRQITDEKTDEI